MVCYDFFVIRFFILLLWISVLDVLVVLGFFLFLLLGELLLFDLRCFSSYLLVGVCSF